VESQQEFAEQILGEVAVEPTLFYAHAREMKFAADAARGRRSEQGKRIPLLDCNRKLLFKSERRVS